jgi:hypothetical protein
VLSLLVPLLLFGEVIFARELAGNVLDKLVEEGLGALTIAGLVGANELVITFGSDPVAFPALPPRVGGSASPDHFALTGLPSAGV